MGPSDFVMMVREIIITKHKAIFFGFTLCSFFVWSLYFQLLFYKLAFLLSYLFACVCVCAFESTLLNLNSLACHPRRTTGESVDHLSF